MRICRQHAVAFAALLSAVAALSFFLTADGRSPGTTDSAKDSQPPPLHSSQSPALPGLADPATDATLDYLDKLSAHVNFLAKTALRFRKRHYLQDPDPEEASAVVTVDDSSATLTALEEQRREQAKVVHTIKDQVDKPQEATGSSPDTTLDSVQRSQKMRLEIEQAHFALLTETLETIHHPAAALAEYQRAKSEYLAAKSQLAEATQRLLSARLTPLPPERTKDWRVSVPTR